MQTVKGNYVLVRIGWLDLTETEKREPIFNRCHQ